MAGWWERGRAWVVEGPEALIRIVESLVEEVDGVHAMEDSNLTSDSRVLFDGTVIVGTNMQTVPKMPKVLIGKLASTKLLAMSIQLGASEHWHGHPRGPRAFLPS